MIQLACVAVSGPPGSGKTSVARAIAERFDLRYVSAGAIFRRLAKERGVSLDVLSRQAEEDTSIDLAIDAMTEKEEEKGNVVLDGHLTAWVAKKAIKIYVKASPEERYNRIAERDGIPLETAKKENSVREESEKRRFKKLYNYDLQDLTGFDLVVDNTYLGEEETKQVVLNFLTHHRLMRGDQT